MGDVERRVTVQPVDPEIEQRWAEREEQLRRERATAEHYRAVREQVRAEPPKYGPCPGGVSVGSWSSLAAGYGPISERRGTCPVCGYRVRVLMDGWTARHPWKGFKEDKRRSDG